jgi:hypothetical protein
VQDKTHYVSKKQVTQSRAESREDSEVIAKWRMAGKQIANDYAHCSVTCSFNQQTETAMLT